MKVVELPHLLEHPEGLQRALERVGVSFSSSGRMIRTLPFSLNDTTCGSETELQVAVVGKKQDVDLPFAIEQSNFFANIIKRAAAGDTPKRLMSDMERYLSGNRDDIWENSWVCFPRCTLSPYAQEVLARDLLSDKGNPSSGRRRDSGRFVFANRGEDWLRIPISYLLKLALADVIGSQESAPKAIRQTSERLMGHYLNDNTSPETFSFHVIPLRQETGMGQAVARETAKRFLLTQLLVMYANDRFALRANGQQALVYSAPHPPIRQKELNNCLSDAFYRDLFMSPCLSGWDRGEEKHRYMHLCHQVLSRSQLNAVAKLRDAGIIANNLVVLPNISNVSLANNGTHLSIGSRRISAALGDPSSGFTATHEKHMGDLTIKFMEHFLPLFVGTYTASPYRLAFTDFHPERALGFLPHELDYTHLRMIWRRWRKKARLSFFGRPVTPFGPEWLDRTIAGMLQLKGDFVPDFRLIDYLVCLLSTDRSPALNGKPGNDRRLKEDLDGMGVFDNQMSLYLLYKLREFSAMGFSGFEGRHYSLFESLEDDFAPATELQTLVTALAYKYMAEGKLSHASIPDDPSVESERRQIFFGTAIGIPTFYVRKDTGNLILRRIIANTDGTRMSRRYPGYLRVHNHEYRKALLRLLLRDAPDLIEAMGLEDTVRDLMLRLDNPDRHSAAGRLTRGILDETGASSPFACTARDFNLGAERYYRGTLRRRHVDEALRFLEEDLLKPESGKSGYRFDGLPEGGNACSFLQSVRRSVLDDTIQSPQLRTLINMLIMTIGHDSTEAETCMKRGENS